MGPPGQRSGASRVPGRALRNAKPRGGPSALAGGKSEPVRLGVRNTHALFALKVQRKLSNGVAGFSRRRIIFGSAEIAGNPRDISAMQIDDQ